MMEVAIDVIRALVKEGIELLAGFMANGKGLDQSGEREGSRDRARRITAYMDV